jgi:RNA polymerase sigma factor (sigma-70 family)
MDPDALASLLQRIREGDDIAALQFVKHYEKDILREIRMQLTDPRLTQVFSPSDVCQGVLISFFVRFRSGELDIKDEKHLLAWLKTVATNKVKKLARHEKRQKRDVRRRDPLDSQNLRILLQGKGGMSSFLAAKELLEEILKRLPPELREAAEKRGQGHTWKEIGEALNLGEDAIRQRFNRALKDILSDLDPENQEP